MTDRRDWKSMMNERSVSKMSAITSARFIRRLWVCVKTAPCLTTSEQKALLVKHHVLHAGVSHAMSHTTPPHHLKVYSLIDFARSFAARRVVCVWWWVTNRLILLPTIFRLQLLGMWTLGKLFIKAIDVMTDLEPINYIFWIAEAAEKKHTHPTTFLTHSHAIKCNDYFIGPVVYITSKMSMLITSIELVLEWGLCRW